MKTCFYAMRMLIASLLIALTGAVYAAPTLWVSDNVGTLGTVDAADGTVQVIGAMGIAMSDIAFAPSGLLYGVAYTSLYSIDPTTAAPTLIGNLGTSVNSLVFAADGTLYGANSSLYTISSGTGTATVIGNAGTSYNSSGDLAFIAGQLYLSSAGAGSDALVRLDAATGAGTAIGPIGASGVYGLATNDNVTLYGVAGTSIYTINVATGAGALLSEYGGQGLSNAYGTAFFGESAPPVPEPSGWALALAGLGLLGTVRIRKARGR